jgi:hypothetical protein
MHTACCCRLLNKNPSSSLKTANKYSKLKAVTFTSANQSVTLSSSLPKSSSITKLSVVQAQKILSTKSSISLTTIKYLLISNIMSLCLTLRQPFTSKSASKKSLVESHSFTTRNKFKRLHCYPELISHVSPELMPKVKTFTTTESLNSK